MEHVPVGVRVSTKCVGWQRTHIILSTISRHTCMQPKPAQPEDARFYAANIVSALAYIHGKGVAYRDLKVRTCNWMYLSIVGVHTAI